METDINVIMLAKTIKKILRPEEFLLLILVIALSTVCYFPGVTCPPSRGFFELLFVEGGSTFIILLVPYIIINSIIIPTFKRTEKPLERTKNNFKCLLGFFRNYLPFIVIFVFYTYLTHSFETGDLTHFINPKDYTTLFSEIDNALLGRQFSHWSQRITTPLLTEVMFVFYSLHFIYPLAIGILLYTKGSTMDFRNFMLAIVLVCFIGYVGYFVFPGISPVYFLDYDFDLSGKAVTRTIEQFFLEARNAQNDCCVFPSLHVGLATVVLLSCWKRKKLFYAIAPLIVLSWFSTLYLRRHWFIDVVFGLLIGVVAVYLSSKVNKSWYN